MTTFDESISIDETAKNEAEALAQERGDVFSVAIGCHFW